MNKVKLHDSLALHLQDAGPLGRMIAHPMLYAIAYRPELNEQYNLQFLQKQDMAKKALKRGDWHQNIFLHERPYRLQALVSLSVVLETCNRIDEVPAMLNEMLPLVYVDAEGTSTNRDLWRLLFGRFEGERNLGELQKLKTGDDELTTVQIFRGYDGDKPDTGFSWTTSKSVAKFFAMRFNENGKVKHKFVRPDEIDFYTDERSEQECVYFGAG